ncbi:hypothetical protein RND81_13G213800 [Saponaria officinalis]|uniref:DUF7792 domain-containing protein n=1 Tax=Saponaria officinalis TaxID=3572 RepID=A0AAW1H3A0_SAPOF
MGDVIKQTLGKPIQLAEQIIKACDEATSFKSECSELKSKTSKLSDLLRQAARSSSDLYERPTRLIIDDTQRLLVKALTLSLKCRPNGLIKRAFTIIPAAAFRKIFSQLDNSVGDVSWLLRVSGAGAGAGAGHLGLPPIAANEPVLCLIWEQISIVSMGRAEDRADAAGTLALLARDNDRNGRLIIEEGGVGPLCRLLKEGSTIEGQENAARVLGLLGRDPENVDRMVKTGVCSVFANVLKDGPMKVQAMVAWAVSEFASSNSKSKEIFAELNVVRLLVGHVAFETVDDHSKYVVVARTASIGGGVDEDERISITPPMWNRSKELTRVRTIGNKGKTNPSQVQPDYENGHCNGNGNDNGNGNGNDLNGNGKLSVSRTQSLVGSKARERELEDPKVKATLKAMVAKALWKLAKENSMICRNICESRALLSFAVLLENGEDEVKHNSAMALMEITAVAEIDAELRRSTFKPNSPACKAVVDQILKIIEKDDVDLLVPCVKAIGNIARTFKSTESRIIGPLVNLLDEREPEVTREAAIALTKFAGSENYLHMDHSKAIIMSGGIKHLVQLVYFGEQKVQKAGLVLLSYIALHVPDSRELADCEVSCVLQWASKQSHLSQDEYTEMLLFESKCRLELYQARIPR